MTHPPLAPKHLRRDYTTQERHTQDHGLQPERRACTGSDDPLELEEADAEAAGSPIEHQPQGSSHISSGMLTSTY